VNHYTYMITTPAVDAQCMYIGVRSSKNLPEKDAYMSSSKPLRAWLKQNPRAGRKVVLATWATRAEALEHEIFLHDCFDVSSNEKFWNQSKATTTHFDVTGLKRPQSFRDAIATRMRGRVVSDITRKKLAAAAVGRTPSNKGVPLSEETKAKLSAALKGKPGPNLGRVFSEESRAKNAAAKRKNPTKYWLGKTRSEEDKQKFRAARLGKVTSNLTKALLSKKLAGYVHQIVECPHCGKQGGETGMKRWHFENCRDKVNSGISVTVPTGSRWVIS